VARKPVRANARILLDPPAEWKIKRGRDDGARQRRFPLPSIIMSPIMSIIAIHRGALARLTLPLLVLGLVACGHGADDGGYFPLTPGSRWQYRVERTTMDGSRELRHALSVLDPLANQPADLRVRVTLDGQRYLYRLNDDGIYRVGIERRHGPRSAEDDQQQLVMPRHPVLDQQWQGRSSTAVLESSAAPWETLFRAQVPLTMQFRVAALDAAVTTPAGAFKSCLLLEGQGQTDADLGNGVGATHIEVTTREWYAPGVGLVRMERHEQTSAKGLSAGALVMELDDWSQP